MELSKIIELINDFLVPINKLEQNNINEISLLNILNNIIDGFKSRNADFYRTLEITESEEDSLWIFALISIHLLIHLNNSKFEPSQTGCYLSVKEEQLVTTICQLVVCFGIHYNLEDNIGVSIERLSKFGVNIKLKRTEIEAKTRNARLRLIIDYLNKIRAYKREHIDLIQHYFYRKYLHEIVCSLIQLNYSPNSTEQGNDQLKTWLEVDLIEETPGSSLISALLMAQSSPSSSTSWFTLKIGQLLTKCLLQPNSVMNIIKAILTEINAISNVNLESDWKKCDLIAQIVAQCPRDMKPAEYVKFIAPQLLDLFFKFDLKYVKHFHRVAGSIYSVFARRWPQLTFEHLTSRLIKPFRLNSSLTNKQFHECLNHLNLVFILSSPPCWATLNQLPVDIIYLLFDIYTQLGKKLNTSKIKSVILDILKLYIKMMPNELLNPFLFNLLKNNLFDESADLKKIAQFNFEMFDDDLNEDNSDISVIKFVDNCKPEPANIKSVELKCTLLVRLIKSVQDGQLEIGYLLYLFNELNKVIQKQVDSIDQNSQNDQTLIRLEKNLTNIGRDINLKIILFTQMSALFESIDAQLILDQNAKIIDFCAFILKNLLNLTKSTSLEPGDDWQENEFELIRLLLSVISVFTTGVLDIDFDIKKKLLVLIPMLIDLKEAYPNTEIENMADSLHISIGTLGGVPSQEFPKKNSASSSRPLIEEILDDSDYARAMRDLNDPLMPVKAHGLVVLRKLIDSKNPTCLENKTSLIDLFMKYLKNDDSYVYLAAIYGLISGVELDPNRIMAILIEEYSLPTARLDIETRLKIGEVLTKTVRNFNELVPKYGRQLINAFLIGCKQSDDFLKASSLSNLGETCKLLNYSLGENISEILNCLSSLIDDSERSIQVKRSASMVLKMIIEGLRKETFIDVLGSSIRPLYKLLVRIKSTSQDDVIRLNCQLTSDYLNELMKESMFPKQKLQKEIKILTS